MDMKHGAMFPSIQSLAKKSKHGRHVLEKDGRGGNMEEGRNMEEEKKLTANHSTNIVREDTGNQ